jgi:hypothetical protein
MNTEHPFGLSAEEFWTDPWKNKDAVRDETTGSLRPALVIDGPDLVDLDARRTLPVPLYHSVRLGDLRGALLEDTAILVGVRLSDRMTWAGMATPPLEGAREAPDPGGDESFIGLPYDIDARGQLGLPWRPAEWMFQVLQRDRTSNRVKVKLDRPRAFKDPEVEEYLARKGEEEWHPEMPEGMPPVDFGEHADSPPAPKDEGVAVAAPRVVPIRKDMRAMLRGTVRVTPLPNEIVRTPLALQPKATAIVPVTLLVTGSESVGPLVARIPVEIRAKIDAKKPAPVTGWFSFDLLAAPQQPRSAQTFFVYAFAGQPSAGPVLCALVDDARPL